MRVPRARLPEVVAERGPGHRADHPVDDRRVEATALCRSLRLEVAQRPVGLRHLGVEALLLVGKACTPRGEVPVLLVQLVTLRGELGVHGRKVGDRGVVGLVGPVEQRRRPHPFARALGVEDRGTVAALGLVSDDGASLGDPSQLLAARLARRDLLLDVCDLVAEVLEGGLLQAERVEDIG